MVPESEPNLSDSYEMCRITQEMAGVLPKYSIVSEFGRQLPKPNPNPNMENDLEPEVEPDQFGFTAYLQ